MAPLLIAVAFIFGLAAKRIGLPPLVGFLAAGFALNAAGAQSNETLQKIADFGVTLLLFSIGLKLRLQTLARPQVWASASLHMLVTVAVLGAGILGLGAAGLTLFADIDYKTALLLGFALSFSSTVFAVKILEEKGETASLHGRVSVGILIMQDIFAVLFLVLSTGKTPSLWAFALPPALLLARPVVTRLVLRCGHGEMLLLFGLVLTFAGSFVFEAVQLKGDLGALIAGILIAGHPKADELAKSLLGFKDLFLVGFFLNIGLTGAPSLSAFAVALLLTLALPFKAVLFFLIMARFKLRARTALLGSLSLASYSEFGLIVGAVGVAGGLIGSQWLVIIAIALSLSFMLASPLNASAHALYARLASRLSRFETATRLPDDEFIEAREVQVAVFGMGRLGTGAYDAMRDRYGEGVVGVDYDLQSVTRHCDAGRNVILGDAADSDFWLRIKPPGRGTVRAILLAMPTLEANLAAARIIAEGRRARGTAHSFKIIAIAKYDDEIETLRREGVDGVFNVYADAGAGFARHVIEQLDAVS